MENISSEQELKKLLEEGKITEEEYSQLREAINTPKPGKSSKSSESEFQAFRKRVLKGGRILCIFSLPIGIILNLWPVWILSILGIIVATIKLKRMGT